MIGHEFAAPVEGFGNVNMALAELIADRYADMSLYISSTIAGALREIAPEIKPDGVFHGISADTMANTGGTWEELRQAKALVGERKVNPVLIGQAYHVGRVALQAQKAGLSPILPAGLPAQFDPESRQWWCRSRLAWTAREIPGVLVLRRRGQL